MSKTQLLTTDSPGILIGDIRAPQAQRTKSRQLSGASHNLGLVESQDGRLDDLGTLLLQDVRGVLLPQCGTHGRLPQTRGQNPGHQGYPPHRRGCHVHGNEILGNSPPTSLPHRPKDRPQEIRQEGDHREGVPHDVHPGLRPRVHYHLRPRPTHQPYPCPYPRCHPPRAQTRPPPLP